MKKKILVIDDDATIRFLLEKLLEKEYDVISMEDGYLALDWLNGGNVPDLILLDFEMPNINGNTIIKRVKFTSGLRTVPIVILSGSENKEVIQNFIKLGASGFIHKPFKELELRETLSKVFKN